MSNGKEICLLTTYPVGASVYCFAYAEASDTSSYFLCHCLVLKEVDEHNYKLIVLRVNPHSPLCGIRPEIASRLLGRKIVRHHEQLSYELPLWNRKGEINWLEADKRLQQTIDQLRRKLGA